MTQEDNKVPWYRVVWFTQNIPKHAFVLWFAIQNKLTTQDRIRRWGSYYMMACPLCYQDMDSHPHLFFKCEYANQFWGNVVRKVGMSCGKMDWEEIVSSFANSFNGNSIASVIKRLALAASVYLIWQERNNRIFREEQRSCDELFKIWQDNMRFRMMSLKVKPSVAVLKVQEEWNVKMNVVS